MTAVALLMSIFRSKPSCFCVLDEVDAALDDSNVDRFCRVVEEFTTLSSFVVITHHKRTMHQADMLFGVTMQERGVSKRVSVRIDQVGADGEIAEAKPAPAVVDDESPIATASEHYSDPDSATKAKPRRKRGTVEMNMSPAAAVLNGSELPPMPLTIGDGAPRDDSAALEQAQRAEADERLVRRGLAAMRKRKPVQVPLADQILETPAQGDAAAEVVHQDHTALQS